MSQNQNPQKFNANALGTKFAAAGGLPFVFAPAPQNQARNSSSDKITAKSTQESPKRPQVSLKLYCFEIRLILVVFLLESYN